MKNLDELLWLDFSRENTLLIAVLTYLEDLVLDLGHIEHLALWLFANVATQSVGLLQLKSFAVLSGRKIDDTPILKKPMNSYNQTDIANKSASAVGSR